MNKILIVAASEWAGGESIPAMLSRQRFSLYELKVIPSVFEDINLLRQVIEESPLEFFYLLNPRFELLEGFFEYALASLRKNPERDAALSGFWSCSSQYPFIMNEFFTHPYVWTNALQKDFWRNVSSYSEFIAAVPGFVTLVEILGLCVFRKENVRRLLTLPQARSVEDLFTYLNSDAVVKTGVPDLVVHC